MTSIRCKVVPDSSATITMELQRDCEAATALLHKLLEEYPELTCRAAYMELKIRMERICLFPWNQMTLTEHE
ncbi:MAG: hypothetical protein KDA89_14440 [Planctomycetaceae bacterium]|nr:hypothetical protein [Planctomycetaceae bacterium]